MNMEKPVTNESVEKPLTLQDWRDAKAQGKDPFEVRRILESVVKEDVDKIMKTIEGERSILDTLQLKMDAFVDKLDDTLTENKLMQTINKWIEENITSKK